MYDLLPYFFQHSLLSINLLNKFVFGFSLFREIVYSKNIYASLMI